MRNLPYKTNTIGQQVVAVVLVHNPVMVYQCQPELPMINQKILILKKLK